MAYYFVDPRFGYFGRATPFLFYYPPIGYSVPLGFYSYPYYGNVVVPPGQVPPMAYSQFHPQQFGRVWNEGPPAMYHNNNGLVIKDVRRVDDTLIVDLDVRRNNNGLVTGDARQIDETLVLDAAEEI